MVVASQLRVGAVVRFEGQEYKVVATEYRPGQGRMSGAMHARLRNLETGTFWEHAFRSELKLEEMSLDKHTLEFLYADENHCFFMDPESFEQTEIPIALVGVQAQAHDDRLWREDFRGAADYLAREAAPDDAVRNWSMIETDASGS